MSIALMRSEIENQRLNLLRVARHLASRSAPSIIPRKTVFTGSGDSWACALFAKAFSNEEARAEDPAELSENLSTSKSRYIVIISASGGTRANLDLARKAARSGIKTIAVTSDSKSLLAKICDAAIVPNYSAVATLTAGTISFTSGLLVCARLLGWSPMGLKLEQPLLAAEKWARSVVLNRRGKCLLVGSGTDRALAEYGACKIQEVLGNTAFSAYPEQVGHALLFSLDISRDSIVCIDTVGSPKVRELYDRLSHARFRVFRLVLHRSDSLMSSLEVCFRLQYLALLNAERRGQVECAFVNDRSRLQLSNELIY